ncbi:MAG: hypothetical protein JRH14_21620 [Deltaproteobacteria bacterium]|nr:hypothetical protein [Deltaproteobacteria bacterium]
MRFGLALILLAVLGVVASACSKKAEEIVIETEPVAPVPVVAGPAEYVGTEACASCHEAEHEGWAGSHHDLAMQKATPETVRGDFDDVTVKYYKETTRFVRDGDAFAIEALGADGKRARFPVIYTFGVDPMQQYLVEVEPGRLQSFLFAWDTRPKGEGGQRWFHLQPDEYIEPGDPLHWTGPSYNWNYACADCHSTAVKKNYNRASKRYSTEYFEINVGCEACHGPGSRHVELEETKAKRRPSNTGFDRRLPPPEKRKWSFVEGGNIAVLATSQPSDETSTCAPCHSRRADLGGKGPGYHDRYRLAVTRSTSTGRSCRAGCTRRAWSVATATTGTAGTSERRATRCAPGATKPRPMTSRSIIFTTLAPKAAFAPTATCRSARTW